MHFSPDEGTVNVPAKEDMKDLYEVLKSWESQFESENERFSGDALLACEDDLLCMMSCMDNWTDCSLRIFAHHPNKDRTAHVQKIAMLNMNEKVQLFHDQLKFRMTGDNGLAEGVTNFLNSLEIW